jgi:hypothetical protein
MCTSKSPVKVATTALEIGRQVLPDYSHRNSPKVYTQAQLFACLVLKTFFKTDYRGTSQILKDLPDLRQSLQLLEAPHFTTLHKAAKRLLRLSRVRKLLRCSVHRLLKRRRKVKKVALDSSGLDAGHASRYYVQRRAKGQDKAEKPAQKTTYKRFAKLEAVFDCATHLIVGALAGRGPKPDADRFVPLLDEALACVDIDDALADAGFDSESNHRQARQKRGVRSFIPAKIGRPSPKPPTGYWRRLMKRRLNKDYGKYGQRWQAETGFSMIKRRLAVAVAGRSYWARCRDALLLALSHNILIVAANA